MEEGTKVQLSSTMKGRGWTYLGCFREAYELLRRGLPRREKNLACNRLIGD